MQTKIWRISIEVDCHVHGICYQQIGSVNYKIATNTTTTTTAFTIMYICTGAVSRVIWSTINIQPVMFSHAQSINMKIHLCFVVNFNWFIGIVNNIVCYWKWTGIGMHRIDWSDINEWEVNEWFEIWKCILFSMVHKPLYINHRVHVNYKRQLNGTLTKWIKEEWDYATGYDYYGNFKVTEIKKSIEEFLKVNVKEFLLHDYLPWFYYLKKTIMKHFNHI